MISIIQDSKQDNNDIKYETLTKTVVFCYGGSFPDGERVMYCTSIKRLCATKSSSLRKP